MTLTVQWDDSHGEKHAAQLSVCDSTMSMQPVTKRHAQRGLTMVELLVALVLSVFLAGGIIQIFVGNRVSFAFNDGLARIQENARLSLEQMAFHDPHGRSQRLSGGGRRVQ